MPVKSYIAYPKTGKKETLKQSLDRIVGIEVTPAENKELLIVVSDSENEEASKELEEQLESIESLEHLALVAGFSDEANEMAQA